MMRRMDQGARPKRTARTNGMVLASVSLLALTAAGMAQAQESSGPGFSIVIGAPSEPVPATAAPAAAPEVPAAATVTATEPPPPAPAIEEALTPAEPIVPPLPVGVVSPEMENPATIALETDENGITPVEGRLRFDRPGWFWVGQADLTYGRERGGEDYSLGRLAGYTKGMTRSGYTVTAAIDTGEDELDELLDGLDEKNPRQVLDRIAPDDVYPTFGDDSTSYADAPTSGRIYARVEKDGSHVMWGDFHNAQDDPHQLVRSDRTLYGAQALWRSAEETAAGEPRHVVSAYASQPDRLMQRDVLRGTGGSVYFLKRQDILRGTEVVTIRWRDSTSGRVIRSQRLVPGTDYDINYFQGIIDLGIPLTGSASDGGLIVDNPLGDDLVDLVVQYEYVPTTGDVDGMALGARAQSWIGETVRLGVSAQKETTGIADNRLAGVDLRWQRSASTWLSLDVAQSEGPGFGTSESLDGGLEYEEDDLLSAGRRGLSANAVRLEGRADLAELTGGRAQGAIGLWYDDKQEGFVSADDDIDRDQTDWGFLGELALGPASTLTFGHKDFRRDGGEKRRDSRLGMAHQIAPHWTLEGEVAHTDRLDPDGDDEAQGQRTDLGARLTYDPGRGYRLWAFGQATASHQGGLPRNNRAGLGAEADLSDRLSAAAEVSDGNLGFGADASLRWRGENGSTWVSYRMDPMRRFDRTDFEGRDRGIWVLGAERQLGSNTTFRTEQTIDRFGDRHSRGVTHGLRYATEGWQVDGTLTNGRLADPDGGEIRRKGISLAAAFSDGDALKTGLRGEYRTDDGDDDDRDRESWGLSGHLRYKLSEEWRLVSDLDAIISDSSESALRDGRYIEGNLGLAYRPVSNDRLNMLMRYTYLEDLPGPDQVNLDGDEGGPRQKSHIFGIDANYKLNDLWTVGGKLGYRRAEVWTERESGSASVPNTAYLAILRADYHVMHNWDLMAELRTMRFKEAEVTEHGVLAGVWRHVGPNMKLGLGYQWGDVSDDLRSLDGRKAGVFMNVVGSF
ncbi:TonB-dependent receptor [Paracoccus zhejiangensis]|uniref:Uncharacterized protein n=1 Tax=Paracoccus zhejiangensis TaxID=1077935 RepID=A0A2H5EYB5_9RHOB|nr:hypothetical protein [Paracoccus zhejiangensis]AUH64295.1 hypothetical protein CX676_09080 [Paracoccus zhejiangensis]